MITLADIYLLSGSIGFVYVMGTAAMGFAHGSDGGADSGDGGDAGGADGSSDAGGADGGAGGDGGSADAGGDGGSADAGGDGGSADAGGDGGGADAGGVDASVVRAVGGFKVGLAAQGRRRRKVDYSVLLLKMLSPSTLMTFGFFFGLSGYVLLHLSPWLGLLSLVPAVIAGAVGYRLASAMTGNLAARMHVSTSFRESTLIGSTAEVSVSIPGGGMGEVTYVAKGVRANAPAKAIDKQQTFRSTSRVMIADIKDGVIMVEPCPDELLRLNEPR